MGWVGIRLAPESRAPTERMVMEPKHERVLEVGTRSVIGFLGISRD